MTKQEKDYEVGYGKPPKHSQFKPGQSGNPKGRPKGSRNLSTDVREMLATPVRISNGGRRQYMSTQHATLMRLREKALNGDNKAMDRLLVLAGLYNNDEEIVVEEKGLSGGDKEIFSLFGRANRKPDIPTVTFVGSDGAGRPASENANDEGPADNIPEADPPTDSLGEGELSTDTDEEEDDESWLN